MKVIKILSNRQLTSNSKLLGTTGEKNATQLKFVPSFTEINGVSVKDHTMKIVFNNDHGSYVKDPEADYSYKLPLSLTVDRKLNICVQFLLGDEVKWASIPTDFIFAKGADDSNEHAIDIESAREELAAAFAAICGNAPVQSVHHPNYEYEFPNFSKMSFDELLQWPAALKDRVGLALNAMHGTEDFYNSDMDSMGSVLSMLYDYLGNLYGSMQRSFEYRYRLTMGLDLNGAEDDKFLKDLQKHPIKSYEDYSWWEDSILDTIIPNLKTQADEEILGVLWDFYVEKSYKEE